MGCGCWASSLMGTHWVAILLKWRVMTNAEMVETAKDPKAMRVLVVDDDESVRRSLAAHLEDLGHAVIHAADGKSAVAKFSKHLPDMVLMDLRMPVIGGIKRR